MTGFLARLAAGAARCLWSRGISKRDRFPGTHCGREAARCLGPGKWLPGPFVGASCPVFGGCSVWPSTRSGGRRGRAGWPRTWAPAAGPRGMAWGGSLALLLAGVALWGRPTEQGALARGVGEADRGTPATGGRAILGGRERVSALNAPSREVWRGKESPLATLRRAQLGWALLHQETVVPGVTPPGGGTGGARRGGVTTQLRLRLAGRGPARFCLRFPPAA